MRILVFDNYQSFSVPLRHVRCIYPKLSVVYQKFKLRKRRARGDLGEERRPRGIHLRVKALCKSQLKLRPVCSQRNIARWGIHVRPTLCLDLATQDCGAWAITVTIKSAPRDARRKMGLNSWSTFIDQCLAGTHRMPCLNV